MKCWRGKKKLQGTKTKNNEERITSPIKSGRTDRMNPQYWNSHRAIPRGEEHNVEATEYHWALLGKIPGTRLKRNGYTNCHQDTKPSLHSLSICLLIYLLH